MACWLDANPQNRKTKRGMNRFVNAWLSRADKQGGSPTEFKKQNRPGDPLPLRSWTMLDMLTHDFMDSAEMRNKWLAEHGQYVSSKGCVMSPDGEGWHVKTPEQKKALIEYIQQNDNSDLVFKIIRPNRTTRQNNAVARLSSRGGGTNECARYGYARGFKADSRNSADHAVDKGLYVATYTKNRDR